MPTQYQLICDIAKIIKEVKELLVDIHECLGDADTDADWDAPDSEDDMDPEEPLGEPAELPNAPSSMLRKRSIVYTTPRHPSNQD